VTGAGASPGAGLVVPPPLVPGWTELPRYGWIAARAFAPGRGPGNAVLAAATWLPVTGQLAGARAAGGAAVLRTPRARAVALLHHGTRCARASSLLGTVAGLLLLAVAVLGLAVGYVALADVRTWPAAAPLLALPAVLLAAAASAPRPAGQGPTGRQDPGRTRLLLLAAWPRRSGAGLAGLCRELCQAADQQGVALELIPRTPALAVAYGRAGFRPGGRGGLLVRPVGPASNTLSPPDAAAGASGPAPRGRIQQEDHCRPRTEV
jgi:hypothetical protein